MVQDSRTYSKHTGHPVGLLYVGSMAVTVMVHIPMCLSTAAAYHVPGVVSQFREVYREALISIVFGSALPVLAVVGFVLLTVALGWKIRKKRNSKYYRKQLLRSVV